jgi:streptogramin lyase
VVETPIATGDGPGAIAVGDGAVWVAERVAGDVARIDPSVDRVTAQIRVGARAERAGRRRQLGLGGQQR